MCINHSDIEYVEFQRQGGGVISSSVRTFDLLIKQRSNNTVRKGDLLYDARFGVPPRCMRWGLGCVLVRLDVS
jgi:hypothetical protein